MATSWLKVPTFGMACCHIFHSFSPLFIESCIFGPLMSITSLNDKLFAFVVPVFAVLFVLNYIA